MADEEKKAPEPKAADKLDEIEDLADDLAALQKNAEKEGVEGGKPKSGLFANKMMLMLIGLGGLVVVLAITLVIVLFVMKDDSTAEVSAEAAASEEVVPAEHKAEEPSAEEAAAEQADAEQAALEAAAAQDNSLIPELTDEEMAQLDKMTEVPTEYDGNDRGSQMNKIMTRLSDIKLDSAEIAAALGEPIESVNPAEKARQDSIRIAGWVTEQQAAVDKRKSELDKREAELKTLERSLDKKITRIEQVESSRTGNLARLYDGMDPKSVANLMANLDDETVLQILPRMNTKNASAVLALMPPRRGAVLSKALITLNEN